MKKKIVEWSALSFLSIVIGLVIGIIDFIFGKTLLYVTDVREQFPFYFIPFLGIAGLATVFLFEKYGKSVKGGMKLVFEVAQGKKETISPILIPLMVVTTWLTHLFGGSAGREGVAVQLGAAVANWLDRQTKRIAFRNRSRLFIVTGMAAGFSGLFQTPIAAAFFAMEVLIIGKLEYAALLPVICGVVTANAVTHALGLEKFSYLLHDFVALDGLTLAKLILLGLVFGIVGANFSRFLKWSKAKADQVCPNPYQKILVGGIILSIGLLALGQGRYAGLGMNLIEQSFTPHSLYAYDWLLKFCFTILTLAIGFQGGEVTPLFAIGASLGVWLAGLLGLPIELCAALGYISVFGSATNTLLAPIFIGGEVFGFQGIPYYVIVVAFAYLINGNRSIYGLQQDIDMDEEMIKRG